MTKTLLVNYSFKGIVSTDLVEVVRDISGINYSVPAQNLITAKTLIKRDLYGILR